MDEVIGFLFCVLIIGAAAVGFGFWLMSQRVDRLQRRLDEVEASLSATRGAAVSDKSTPPIAASPLPEPPASRPMAIDASLPEPIAAAQGASFAITGDAPNAIGVRPASLPPARSAMPSVPPPTLPKPPRKPIPVLDWFLKSHVLVQIGLVVLFIGVALLLRYAVDQGWLSVEIRHIGAAVGGLVVGVVGWVVRGKRRSYGLALEGGGLAILYMTAFSAYRLYDLLPASLAFGAFAALGVLGVALALLQNARILAYASMIGAFAAPLLVADGGGSYVALLGYYAVLTLAALAMAAARGWQGLGVLSLLVTYIVGIAFTFDNYVAGADYPGMQLFVAFFFAIFLAAGLLFAIRKPAGRHFADLLIAALNPIFAIIWQLGLVNDFDKGAGYSLLAGGAIYLALFAILTRRRSGLLGIHRELSLFWGLFMLSLAVPVFFEARITASIWAVAGAVWVWIAGRRTLGWLAPWGLVTQAAAGIIFLPTLIDMLGEWMTPVVGRLPFVNDFTLGWALLGLAGLASSYFMTRQRAGAPNTGWRALSAAAFLWGAVWWFGGGIVEAGTVPEPYIVSSIVLFLTLSTAAMAWLGARVAFAWLELPLWGLLPALGILALLHPLEIDSPLHGGAWLVWPLALAVHIWMLRRNDHKSWIGAYHAGGVWLFAYLVASWINGLLGQFDVAPALAHSAVLLALAAIVWVVTSSVRRLPAFAARHATAYALWGVGPIAAAGLLYLVAVNLVNDGAMGRLPFLPVLNSIALSSAAMLAASLYWLLRMRTVAPESLRAWIWQLRWLWGIVMVVALSMELARIAHHMLGVPFTVDSLFGSPTYQAMLSVAWGLLALGLMFWGSRAHVLTRWIAGAIVLGFTVLKLFLVDLSGIGTIPRIVSFIGIGLLILVIAFVAPAPSRKEAEESGK